MNANYEGSIQHTPETICALYKTIYLIYEKKRVLVRIVMGMVLIVIAFGLDLSVLLQVALLMVGAWLLVSRDFAATTHADKAIRARNGEFPSISYFFHDTSVELRDKTKLFIKYNRIAHIAEDTDYIYLIEDKNSVCMIDKKSIGTQPLEAFLSFLEEKTGKTRRKNKSFAQINFYDLLQLIKK